MAKWQFPTNMQELEVNTPNNPIDKFQVACCSTAIFKKEDALNYLALGLASEAGEVAGKVKKHLRDGVLDKEALALEVFDTFWYGAVLLNELDMELSEVLAKGIAKLKSRAERGVIGGNGDDR